MSNYVFKKEIKISNKKNIFFNCSTKERISEFSKIEFIMRKKLNIENFDNQILIVYISNIDSQFIYI